MPRSLLTARRCFWVLLALPLVALAACGDELEPAFNPNVEREDAGQGDADPDDRDEPDAGPQDAGPEPREDAEQDATGEPDAGEPDAPAEDARRDGGDEPDAGEPDLGEPDLDEPDLDEPDEDPYPARYRDEAHRSPINASVARTLRAIRARSDAPDDLVFMKVGASGTLNTNFMTCFVGGARYRIDLAGEQELGDTIEYFRMGDADGSTPFDRTPYSAVVGRTALWAITGDPSPLEQETSALNPRFALVNYGTNDMQQGATYRSALWPFYDNLSSLLDQLLAQGIIPILTGLPPRSDNDTAPLWVPTYNTVTRGMAEALQLPYINLFEATRGLDDLGLGPDGLHGNAYQEGGRSQPCVFTEEGLGYLYNVRNRLTLQTLDEVRRVVLEDQPAPSNAPDPHLGGGSPDEPFVVDRLPFTHHGDTSGSPHRVLDAYPACDRGQDESGPEVYYRLTLDRRTPLRIMVLDRGQTDIDLHLLGARPDAASCVQRDDRIIELTLDAGTHTLVLDTYTAQGQARSGPYLLAITACDPADADCR